MQAWHRKFPAFAALNISVNIAGRQLQESNLINQIEQILADTGLDGSYLKLELTESMLVDNIQNTVDTLLQLKAMDIKLSIDDFGTGYSSLSYLHRFPIDTLKIDRSFINKIGSNPEECAVVKTIITLAHTLGVEAIAEGVETSEQSANLQAWGCEFGQGYFFAKALNCSAIEVMLSA
jgi:EAL domain-containing protein (putative c-di-GMP-specific phosphodiesterase class I)